MVSRIDGSVKYNIALPTVVASVFVFQIDEVQTKVLSTNSISEFSHSLGHKRTLWGPRTSGIRIGSFAHALDKTLRQRSQRATLRPKLRKVPRRSLSMAMAFDCSSLRWVSSIRSF